MRVLDRWPKGNARKGLQLQQQWPGIRIRLVIKILAPVIRMVIKMPALQLRTS